ncbi:hypothetical protein ABKV19_005576 [Rosa sericea]
MTAASSCSDIIPRKKHDVFLSFRGEDTRYTFTSHLYEALCQKKIQTYIDYKLERGDEIAPALLEAISESKLSVIIFSKNYASSTWCLDELVHILECRDRQFVIPIFYGVDPSDVRKQSGSYADAFVEHEKRFKDPMDKVLRWRNALTTAANISGFDFQTIRPESDLVKRVVNDILVKLDGKSQNAGGLERWVGMDKHIIRLVELLCLDSQDVRIVGIWGMGGIGKTTIADVVFHRLSFEFEACCFIKDVREASETKDGLPYDLRNDLFRTLLKDEKIRIDTPSIGLSFMTERLRRTKALIVLDDVSEFSQLEFFAGGDFNLFGPGSRILVTTRNKRILGNLVDDDKIYEVKELDVDEALELFKSRAFRNKSPPGDYTTFAREVVDYAGGNPLALKILGGVFYHCKSNKDWKGELDRLKKFPDKGIHKVLRLSYDGLGDNEKEIFLEIACCHKGKHIDVAERILNACGFSANAGVRLLIDMALISVDESSRFVEMHDLIQEMGREIVRDVKDPGKRSRLWLANEVRHLLEKNTGTEDIECIVMNMDDLIRDLYVNAASFEKMRNLRLLDFYSYNSDVTKVHLPPGFDFLPEALKYLRWHFYPLTSLPSRFSLENLVELDMRNSRLEQLWNKGVQINLPSLKRIDLSQSPSLESLPVELPSGLQFLNLTFCDSLRSLPVELPSGLQFLNLTFCDSLRSLPVELPSGLQFLNLRYCNSLRSLPVELPSGLESLDLFNCGSLRSLPVELHSGLKRLNLSYCKSLRSLPVELPSGLESMDLSNCESLGSLPVELPSGLEYMDLSNCESLGSLPVELPPGLEYMDLSNCESLGSLPKLPWLLRRLDADGCTSLETVSSSMRTAPIQGRDQLRAEQFSFINCVKLDQSARSNIMADAQLRVMRYASRPLSKWSTIKFVCPGNEIPKWMRYQSEGCSINIKLPPHSFRQGFLGYALCIVLAFNNYTPPPINKVEPTYFSCETHHKTNTGHEDWCKTLHVSVADDIILNSDHVFLWYFRPDFVRSESTINREDWVKASEASFDFMLYQHNHPEKIPLDLSTVRVKRCGVSLLYAQDFEKLVEGIDEDVVMEPKQVVEEEDIIIKTKRRRDESELSGSGTASFKEEDNDQLPPQSSKRKINIM